MSNARKLQTEMDRVMKKVDEGVELFDDIWEKVYSAEQQNQKEKYEMDLKKEIKKLQRLRDQIKTWIGSSDIKDKSPLLEARRLIETKMEQFKICEKETKTKTYSKEGLARQDKLDPTEEAKLNTTNWLGEYIDKIHEQVEEKDFEIEKLSAGKGKKTNKHQIEQLMQHIANHKFHMNKLEGIIRLVNNDRVDAETVDLIKDDLDYYLDSYEEEDYMQAYDEEYIYETLGLDELDVVNVDRVTQMEAPKKSDDTASASGSKGSSKSKKGNKASGLGVIPMSIGRARTIKEKEPEKEVAKPTPVKVGGSPSTSSSQSVGSSAPVVTRASVLPPSPAAGGTSMAAILKRESEQQEKERQKLLREQQAKQQAEQLRQQQVQRQQQEAQLRQQEALRQQQQAQQEAVARQQQEALRQQQAQQEAAVKQQQAALLAQQQAAEQNAQTLKNQQMQSPHGQNSALDILTSGLGGLGLGGVDNRSEAGPNALVAPAPTNPTGDAGTSYLTALNDSFATAPNAVDNERNRPYTPQNPYPTPASYPSTPSSVFENPAVFEKLGTDCLFFIFYYAQGTYQQYLAARELKKQSWRFHKKYMTWFQRHEEPKVTTDDYEQGTYVYFDYETGWCTRIKQDFRFEYSFLEDSLS